MASRIPIAIGTAGPKCAIKKFSVVLCADIFSDPDSYRDFAVKKYINSCPDIYRDPWQKTLSQSISKVEKPEIASY